MHVREKKLYLPSTKCKLQYTVLVPTFLKLMMSVIKNKFPLSLSTKAIFLE